MSLSVLIIGAHPDDPDIRAGGFAHKCVTDGHDVRFVSMTDGRAGHHEQPPEKVVRRRQKEARAAASIAGIEYDILDIPDGRLRPTLEAREMVIRLIRQTSADLVVSHRPNDYHPDHRYTAQVVRDAAYTVTVPNICPDTPALESNPVFLYLFDVFDRPYPFDPDFFVPMSKQDIERKYAMLDCHESQLYEWLPYTEGVLQDVPDGTEQRREWLKTNPLSGLAEMHGAADRFRDRLIDNYGEQGKEIGYVEPFELSEYGGELTSELEDQLGSLCILR